MKLIIGVEEEHVGGKMVMKLPDPLGANKAPRLHEANPEDPTSEPTKLWNPNWTVAKPKGNLYNIAFLNQVVKSLMMQM